VFSKHRTSRQTKEATADGVSQHCVYLPQMPLRHKRCTRWFS